MPKIQNNQYILVDFWATWCGPCIKAMDHLEELKKTTGDKVVFISLSNENPEVVRNFLLKRDLKTNIATDYEGMTFQKFGVESLPYAVLIAPNGKIVWTGKPGDLSHKNVASLISQSTPGSVSVDTKIITKKTKDHKTTQKHKYFRKDNITAAYGQYTEVISFYTETDSSSVAWHGNLSEIAAAILSMPSYKFQSEKVEDRFGYLILDTKITEENKWLVFDLFLSAFKLTSEEIKDTQVCYTLSVVDKTMLWSKDIYEWSGDSNPSHIHDDHFIQADNFSLSSLAFQLSNIFKIPFIAQKDYHEIHDWNLSFENIEDLKSQLLHEYGVEMEKTNTPTITYILK